MPEVVQGPLPKLFSHSGPFENKTSLRTRQDKTRTRQDKTGLDKTRPRPRHKTKTQDQDQDQDPDTRQDKTRTRQDQDQDTRPRQDNTSPGQDQMYRGILPQSDSDWGEFLYTFDLGLLSLVFENPTPLS